MNKAQEKFEYSIILESDLGEMELDELSHYNTLQELMLSPVDSLNFDARKILYSIIQMKLIGLSPIQIKIAGLKYIEQKTYREISIETGKSISTISYHIGKIDKILDLSSII